MQIVLDLYYYTKSMSETTQKNVLENKTIRNVCISGIFGGFLPCDIPGAETSPSLLGGSGNGLEDASDLGIWKISSSQAGSILLSAVFCVN